MLTGPAKGRENRKLSMSRVDWSAQCVSSTTTSSGPASARVSSRSWTAEKMLPRSSDWSSSFTGPSVSRSRRPGWRRARVG